MPPTTDLYLIVMYVENTQFFLIKKQGERFVELSRVYREVSCQNIIPTFFIGQDRVLTVYTLVAGDGGFCGNYAFEYKNESLKAIGEINVFDIPHEDEREYGTIFGRSPFENATAEFRDNIYYITMRGKGNLYASGNDNRNARKLAPREIPVTYFYDGTTWRPSGGKQISQSNYLAFSSQRDGNQEIYLIDITTGRATNLSQSKGDDGYPRCSPDGRRIAFATNRDGYWEIYLMYRDGRGQQNLTKDRGGNGYMDWSPDGQSLVFASTRNGERNNEIYTIRADGYGLRRLTTHRAEDVHPAWSPDGRKIAFASERNGNRQIYVMNADGTNLTRLMSNRWYDDYPAWSPDGSQIAFSSDRDSSASDRLDIYVANVDGSNVKRITSHLADDRHPTWSLDGSLLAFASDRDGNRDIFVIRADGTGLKKVVSFAGNDEHPHWCKITEGSGQVSPPDEDTVGRPSLRRRQAEITAWEGNVDPRMPWQSTGLKVRRGETVQITASGTVTWDPNPNTVQGTVGPNGYGKASKVDDKPWEFPVQEAGTGALIMRIGDKVYFVGENTSITGSQDGVIEFMINDRFDWLFDNLGSFSVGVRKK